MPRPGIRTRRPRWHTFVLTAALVLAAVFFAHAAFLAWIGELPRQHTWVGGGRIRDLSAPSLR